MDTKPKNTSTNVRFTDEDNRIIERLQTALPHPPGEKVSKSAVVRSALRALLMKYEKKKAGVV